MEQDGEEYRLWNFASKNQEMREFSYLHLAFPPAWGRRSGAGQDLSPSPGSSPSSWRSTCTSTLIVRVMVYTVYCMLYRIHYALPHESKTKKAPYRQTSSMRHPSGYPVGWVNLYQKFEIEKYTVCGKLILPKKWKDIFLIFFGTTGIRICMDLQIFASFLYPTLLTLFLCSKKIDRK